MNKTNDLCWTCSNLNAGKCPIKLMVKKSNKFNKVETVITECKGHKKIEL